ncbi:hypothetical protein [Fulvivirga sediminis]|uniref:hypothetical protein n=1 Tax=Fulvivirga sediminis TaxID=2803949 RepID=UPI001F308949|nr:hypothetical protein [Fulvivirga sediminis]
MSYNRSRKKTYKAGRKRKKSLIYLLSKGLGQLQSLLNENPQIQLHLQERLYLKTIKKVLEQ